MAMRSVNGKVVLITGGANGIGAEVARRLHDKGAKLVLTDIDETLLKEVGARLGGDRVLSAVADVRDLAEMQSATDQGIDRFGGIDIVIANAGIATFGSVLNVDPAAFKTVLDVNALGVFNTVRAALPSVIERRGYVLVVSSLADTPRSPASPRTASPRQASNTSRTRCASRSATWAWMSGRRTCVGSTRRWSRKARRNRRAFGR